MSAPLYLHVSHAAPHAGGGLVNLQPPSDTIAANGHIAHSARRLYAGLVTGLDRSVGRIVAALAEKDMIRNTLIIFVSDNGAPTKGLFENFGSNLPLRGIKNTPYEGAARSTALIWHASLKSRNFDGLFHVTDWLPTLVAAAGGTVNGVIDGVNQWDSVTNGIKSKRNDILITIDDLNGWAAFREGDYKIIVGDLDKEISGYYGMELTGLRHDAPAYENVLLECETHRVLKETLGNALNIDEALTKRKESNLLLQIIPTPNEELCIPTKAKGCLFNITGDPLEAHDLWHSSPQIVRRMTLRLRTLWAQLKPRSKPLPDFKANPSLRNYVWLPWLNNDEPIVENKKTVPTFPLQVSMGELQYIVDLNLNTFKEKMFQSIMNMGESFVKSVSGLFSF